MFAISAELSRELDRRAWEEFKIPGLLLMENAGLRAAEVALGMLNGSAGPVVVICGPGNNGGDGFVCARHLFNRGIDVRTVSVGFRSGSRGDAGINYEIIRQLMPIETFDQARLKEAVLIIDGLFGIGLNRDLEGVYRQTVEDVNLWKKPVLSLDVPSGLNTDTGAVLGVCIRADVTVTFGMNKLGLVSKEGQRFAGEVVVADIGIPRPLLEKFKTECR